MNSSSANTLSSKSLLKVYLHYLCILVQNLNIKIPRHIREIIICIMHQEILHDFIIIYYLCIKKTLNDMHL